MYLLFFSPACIIQSQHQFVYAKEFPTMIMDEEYRLLDNIIADLTNRLRPLAIKSAVRAAYGGCRWGMGWLRSAGSIKL